MEKTSKKSSPRLQLIISIMIMAALFLAELYVMINESANVVLVVGIGVLILIALYFVIDAVLDTINEKDIADREQYDNIYRSEKASHMLMKKHLDEVAKQIKMINQNGTRAVDRSDEIIKAQKALTKISMSQNKESQDRLFIELNNLEASLKDSIFGLSEKLSGFQEEIERLADHIATINTAAIQEAAKTIQVSEESLIEESLIEESLIEESLIEDSSIDNLFAGESEIGVEDELDVLGTLADITGEGLVESEEDILSQLLAAEESVESLEEVDALEELAMAVDKPVEEKAPAPVMDNPNKMMTPEEIAALIAGTNS